MSALTLIAVLPASLFLCWAVWFVVELGRYLISGEYEVDKRLQAISR